MYFFVKNKILLITHNQQNDDDAFIWWRHNFFVKYKIHKSAHKKGRRTLQTKFIVLWF